jgi:death-on-curing protein
VPSQNSFVWIEDDVVFAIHEAQISEHGGALGVRDLGLLASALSRPRNAAAYADIDVAGSAALYALGIIRDRPFIDGNKRVGTLLLEIFLELNGYDLPAGDEEMFGIVMAVAAGDTSEEDFTTWVRGNVTAHDV